MADSIIRLIIQVVKEGAESALRSFNNSVKGFTDRLAQVRIVGQGLKESFNILSAGIGNLLNLSAEAERAEAKVAQAIRSTGGAAGFSAAELKKVASELQEITIIGDDEILNNVTAQLLTFTNITGENFLRTQQAALNLATVLDGDLKSASIQLGKALNDPIQNLSALSRSGIQFSNEQEALIKSLAETNRLAEAQAIILDELDRQYGGQAEAVADLNSGAMAQFQNTLGDVREEMGLLLAEALLPVFQALKEGLEIFQQAPVFIKATTAAVIVLTTAIFALNVGLGPVTLTLAALAAVGIGVSAELNRSSREIDRIREEMRQSSTVLGAYREGLRGVGEEAGSLIANLGDLGLGELDAALQTAQEGINTRLESLNTAVSAVANNIGEQILAIEEQLDRVDPRRSAALSTSLAISGLGGANVILENRRALDELMRSLEAAQAVPQLVELASQLQENINDAAEMNRIFGETQRILDELGGTAFFTQDEQLAELAREIGAFQRAFTEQAALQNQVTERNRQTRLESLNSELRSLEAQRIKLQLIEDEERQLRREFEIQKSTLEVKRQIARETGKAEDISKIEEEIALLREQFRAELEVLQVQRLRREESVSRELTTEREVQRLEIQRSRINLVEDETTRLDEQFRIQEQIIQRRIELASITGRTEDVLRLQQELDLARERLQVERDIALAQQERVNTQEILAALESASQRTAALERETRFTLLQIDEERALAEAQSEEERVIIRQEFAIRRLDIERQELIAELNIQRQRVESELAANRQILESRLALARSEGDSGRAASIESDLTALGQQETQAKEQFAEQQAAIDARYQSNRLQVETQTNAQIEQQRRDLADRLISGQELLLSSLESGYDTLWANITSTTQTGAEKVQAISRAMIDTAIRGIGEWIKADLVASARSVAVHQAGEQAKTAITIQGVAARIGAIVAGIAREIVEIIKSIGMFLAQAAAKLVAFFASLGPIGLVAGLAAIPALIAGARAVIKSVGKFETGAILTEPTLGLIAEGGSPEAAIPLDERGAEFMARLLPKIVIPGATAAGAGNMAELVDRLSREIRNIKIELRAELDAIQFYRKTLSGFNKLENDRKIG